MRGAVPIRCFERVAHMTALGQRDALVRNGRTGDVVAQPFEFGAVIHARPYTGMQRETIDSGERCVTVRFTSGERP